jgi:hypothetical protein
MGKQHLVDFSVPASHGQTGIMLPFNKSYLFEVKKLVSNGYY